MSHITAIEYIANSHDSMSKYGPHKCDYTYDDGQKNKSNVGPVHCSASGRRVLVPLPTFWSELLSRKKSSEHSVTVLDTQTLPLP